MRNERRAVSERGESKGLALSEQRESKSPNPIDALIDDAARQLVAGEPSSSLRGAVRDRVGSRRSHWSLAPAFAGSVALVILAILRGTTLSGPGESPRPPDVARVDVGPALAGVAVEPERPERSARPERS